MTKRTFTLDIKTRKVDYGSVKEITEKQARTASTWQGPHQYIIYINNRSFVGTREEWLESFQKDKPEQVDPNYEKLPE